MSYLTNYSYLNTYCEPTVGRFTISHREPTLFGRISVGFFISNRTQVGFTELKETSDDRANIGGTIIGAPIIGQ